MGRRMAQTAANLLDHVLPSTPLRQFVLTMPFELRRRFLDMLQHFIIFEEDPDSGALHKIIAGYHQFHAVNMAVAETIRASGMGKRSMARWLA